MVSILCCTPYRYEIDGWYRLPKIKAWIDANNPGDPLIPFSVALEERLVIMSPDEKKEEETKVGAASALGKITQAGYSSLDVRLVYCLSFALVNRDFSRSLSGTSRVGLMKSVRGPSGKGQKLRRLRV